MYTTVRDQLDKEPKQSGKNILIVSKNLARESEWSIYVLLQWKHFMFLFYQTKGFKAEKSLLLWLVSLSLYLGNFPDQSEHVLYLQKFFLHK